MGAEIGAHLKQPEQRAEPIRRSELLARRTGIFFKFSPESVGQPSAGAIITASSTCLGPAARASGQIPSAGPTASQNLPPRRSEFETLRQPQLEILEIRRADLGNLGSVDDDIGSDSPA
jgi:hypothetical protein